MVVFGFAATGSAGKASELDGLAAREIGALDECRDGAGEGLDEEEAEGVSQGVAPTLPAPTRLADVAGGMGGKGLVFVALPQLPWRLTAEREDCCVELLSLSTRRPPLPRVEVEELGRMPLGPGRVG